MSYFIASRHHFDLLELKLYYPKGGSMSVSSTHLLRKGGKGLCSRKLAFTLLNPPIPAPSQAAIMAHLRPANCRDKRGENMADLTQRLHVVRRETLPGRWLPVVFYSVNVTLWILTGVLFEFPDLVWLAILPLPALGLYLFRTRRKRVQ